MSQKKQLRERKHKINSEVRFSQVRVIGDGESKIMSSYDASKLAQSLGLDLILINESQNPPIVKIEDYNKFVYNLEKSEKVKQKTQHKVEIKEIQFTCDIAINDLQTKSRKAKEFLKDGDKVRCTIRLKGRQKNMPERGQVVMKRFLEMLDEFCQLEDQLKYDGDKWQMTLKPKK